ncbi:FecR family protein [Prevotella sp. 10(H)]|uniref:FecR family protein n=1 Tax=Prevotella sp. 10(H) TaxID=1158294 RepID=UPI0004A6BFC5|nr:FecR family protein [Prevotella sp. 10(H)]
MESLDKHHTITIEESLLLKYIIGETTDIEKKLIEEWSDENSENEKILTQLAKIYYARKTQQRIKNRDIDSAFHKVEKRINKKRRLLFLTRTAVAASLIIGFLGIASLFLQQSGVQETFMASMITVRSNDNLRTQLVLPDGTEVHLNAGSSLTYPSHYIGKERKVILSGEAYFKVTHNDEQPFIVSTPDKKYNIRVVGTEFNMQAYEEDNIIQTTLVSGSVKLNIKGQDSETVLRPSQKAVYSTETSKLEVVAANTDRETDWMYGRLVFRKTPLPEVLARLSRFYNVEFDVKNKIINTYTFTGTFEDKPLYQVLDYMKISSRINHTITYQKDDKGTTKSVIILRK